MRAQPSRTHAERERKGPCPAPTLYLPAGPGSAGFLIFPGLDGDKLVVLLTAALVWPILILLKARRDDAHLVPPARGWRRPERIAEEIARQSPILIPVEPQAIRAYISIVKRRIRQAAEAMGQTQIPELFEHRRSLGVRLVTDQLEVIDGTSREE